ncbi:MAG TPA: FtsX-like permease family protein, partial [Candidatus Saccharimonadales bacterium]|nr:FtsX-like permease family protein [Candidatus Saccharimonadales bacterium]
GGWISPISLRGKNSAINAYFQQEKGGGVFGKQQAYFAEFASANQARQALLDKSCQINSPDRELNQKEVFGIKLPSDQNNHTCSRDKWPYKLGAFGGNAILVGQIKDKLGSWLLLAGAVIAVIASLILMTMLGRIVADSRKETAIFRALGASRLSIMQVYLTYTTFLILWVIGLSFALGLTLAFTFDYYLSPDFSLAAAVAFSVNNLDKKFGFIGLDWLTLLEIFAIIIVTGLLASVMPILRSVRRNPIKDMREE